MATMARLHLVIAGRVQGVGFRLSAAEVAQGLGVRGWVRNLADGRVELLAEGARPALEALLEHCRQGPAGAAVEGVEARWAEHGGELGRFTVTR
jgi:acylphosphatase